MPRYFKKFSPNVELWMSNGRHLKFPSSNDKFGYLSSDDPQIHNDPAILAEISAGIEKQVGGVQEITAQQYEDEWIKKKSLSGSSPASKPLWREEVSAATVADTLIAPLVGRAKAVAVPDQDADATPAVNVRSLRDRARVGSR